MRYSVNNKCLKNETYSLLSFCVCYMFAVRAHFQPHFIVPERTETCLSSLAVFMYFFMPLYSSRGNRNMFERILLTVLSIMPFGTRIISMFPNLLMANSVPLLKIAEEMVNTKRAGNANLSRKVFFCILIIIG